MAWLPAGKTGPLQITEIGDSGIVAIIEYPGLDDEKILFKWDGRHPHEMAVMQEKIFKSPLLTEQQKFYAAFWMGYFYAHLAGFYHNG